MILKVKQKKWKQIKFKVELLSYVWVLQAVLWNCARCQNAQVSQGRFLWAYKDKSSSESSVIFLHTFQLRGTVISLFSVLFKTSLASDHRLGVFRCRNTTKKLFRWWWWRRLGSTGPSHFKTLSSALVAHIPINYTLWFHRLKIFPERAGRDGGRGGGFRAICSDRLCFSCFGFKSLLRKDKKNMKTARDVGRCELPITLVQLITGLICVVCLAADQMSNVREEEKSAVINIY